MNEAKSDDSILLSGVMIGRKWDDNEEETNNNGNRWCMY